MPDAVDCIGSGELPRGEKYAVVGPIKILSHMNTRPPLNEAGLTDFLKSLEQGGIRLRWEDYRFVLYWPEVKEWPYRPNSAWRDVENVQVNYAALMKRWGLRQLSVGIPMDMPLLDCPLIFCDIETTGLSSNDRIVEISLCRMSPDEEPEWFSTLVNPGRKIPPRATQIHHIKDEHVKGEPRFKDIASRVFDMVSNAVFISHTSSSFDEHFIKRELETNDYDWIASSRLSTLRLAQSLFPELPRYSLSEIAKSLSLPVHSAHRAESDVKTMIALWEKLMERSRMSMYPTVTIGDFYNL